MKFCIIIWCQVFCFNFLNIEKQKLPDSPYKSYIFRMNSTLPSTTKIQIVIYIIINWKFSIVFWILLFNDVLWTGTTLFIRFYTLFWNIAGLWFGLRRTVYSGCDAAVVPTIWYPALSCRLRLKHMPVLYFITISLGIELDIFSVVSRYANCYNTGPLLHIGTWSSYNEILIVGSSRDDWNVNRNECPIRR